MNRRQGLIYISVLLVTTVFCPFAPAGPKSDKPNIVWIMAEDISCDLACYGMEAVRTPTLDQLAADGIRYNRAYVTGPICSPSRSAMMTGMYQTSIDAHHHRSHRQDGYRLPESIKPMTYYLKQAGYYCAIGCGYSVKTDLNFGADSLFDGKDWSDRAEGQPFFAQISLNVTHRGKWWDKTRRQSKHPVDPSAVKLPPIFPDRPEIRMDWALYLDQIEKADDQVRDILQRLDNEGIADNTMVIFIGDNGRCHLRGKGFLYEEGIRVPLIIRGGSIKPGTVSDQLVSMIDVTAQILQTADATIPVTMQGRPFLGNDVTPREYVFAARDRWDDVEDTIRCVLGQRYKYIRNLRPEVPWDSYYAYLENDWVRPTYPLLRKMQRDGQLNAIQSRFFQPAKPDEELYDLQDDPYELKNLAGDKQYETTLQTFRQVLDRWQIQTNDHGRSPETDASKGKANLKIIEKAKHARKKVAP